MRKLIYLALKNVFRNKRRTALMLLILSFSTAVLILYAGFTDYVYWGYRESLINGYYGHLQIYAEGFRKEKDEFALNKLLAKKDFDKILSILKKEPSVIAFAPRCGMVGLISNGEKTINFFARGVDPQKESSFNSFLPIVEGVNLEKGDTNKIVVGKELARKLDLKIGGRATLLSTTISGAINAIDAQVLGLYVSGNKMIDGSGLIVPLQSLQDLLQTDKIQQVVVLLDKTEKTSPVFKRLFASFKKQELKVEGATWEELAEDYFKVVAMYNTVFNFIFIILGVVCILSVSNTFIMSVFERTREIGTMMALGNRASRVVWLFIWEGVILGFLGGMAGLCLGVVLAKLISMHGIYMPPPPGYSVGYTILINLVPGAIIWACLLSIACAVIASLFAAFKASRLKVVEALHYV